MIFKNANMNINYDNPVSISNEPNKEHHKYNLSFREEDITARRSQLLQDIEKFEAERKEFELYSQDTEKYRTDIIQKTTAEANQKHDMMIKTAVSVAESIRRNALHDVTREIEVLKRQAYQTGFEQGQADYAETNKSRLEELVNDIEQINQNKAELFKKYEQQLVQTLLIMVEKVTTRMIAADNTIILDIIKQAAKNFRNSDNVRITVSEMDFEKILPTDFEFLNAIIPKLTHVTAELSNEMASGTAIIDNGTEIIDASTFTQLDFLAEIAKNSGIQS